jgi:hypothetical protein
MLNMSFFTSSSFHASPLGFSGIGLELEPHAPAPFPGSLAKGEQVYCPLNLYIREALDGQTGLAK